MSVRTLTAGAVLGLGVALLSAFGAAAPARAAGPDLAVTVAVRTDRDEGGRRHGRVIVTVRNVGDADYLSAWNQQEIQLYLTETSEAFPRRIKTNLLQKLPFRDLAAGREITLERRITWLPLMAGDATGGVRILRTFKTYTARVVYDPDILSDGRATNDDRNSGNNSAAARVESR
jgi:hypothetical protein